MRTVCFYHKETGLFSGKLLTVTDDTSVELNTPTGHAAMDGAFDSLSQSVDIETGEVIDYQPPSPSVDHEWNAATKRWQLTVAAQSKIDDHAASMVTITGSELRSLRALREFALGLPGAEDRLKAIEAEIVAARRLL